MSRSPLHEDGRPGVSFEVLDLLGLAEGPGPDVPGPNQIPKQPRVGPAARSKARGDRDLLLLEEGSDLLLRHLDLGSAME